MIVLIYIYKNREKVKTEFRRITLVVRASLAGGRAPTEQDDKREDRELQTIKEMEEAVKREKGQRKEFVGDLMEHHKNSARVDAPQPVEGSANKLIQDDGTESRHKEDGPVLDHEEIQVDNVNEESRPRRSIYQESYTKFCQDL